VWSNLRVQRRVKYTRQDIALRKCPAQIVYRRGSIELLTFGARYFCNPDFKSYIEAIPGTFSDSQAKKYEGINSGDYLVQRLTATY
jgi:hypothetical protein